MATQIIPPIKKWGSDIGSHLGTGIGKGLEALAGHKMQELERNRQRKEKEYERRLVTNRFVEGGYDDQTAELLSTLLTANPQGFHHILGMLGGGGSQPQNSGGLQDALQMLGGPPNNEQQNPLQMLAQQEQSVPELIAQQQENLPVAGQTQSAIEQQQPALPQVQQPKVTQPKQNFAQQISKSKEKEKPKTVAEKKHEDDLVAHKDRLVDTITTARRMIDSINQGAKHGLIARGKAAIDPSGLLDRPTEQLEKDSRHLVNLTTGEVKGIRSKYLVQNIEAEKAGLSHSPQINKQILNRTIKDAHSKLRALEKTYPFLHVDNEDIDSEVEDLNSGTKNEELVGKSYKTPDGQYFKWDASLNEHVPARLKGK